MAQLQYHGKKTVPAAIRRDMWTPYFSVHFPATDFGAESGKIAYQRLRGLSIQRQLVPPKDMVTTTQEDIDKLKLKTNPVDMKTMLDDREVRLPVVGQRLPKKMRAKRLMDQKATAVADLAFVLKLYLESGTPEERRKMQMAKFKERMSRMGPRAKSRLQKIMLLEARKRDYIKALASQVQLIDIGKGHLTLDKHAAARISTEYKGMIRKSGGLEKLASIENARAERAAEAELQGKIIDVQAQIDALITGQPLPEEVSTREITGTVLERDTDTAAEGSENELSATQDVITEKLEGPPTVKVLWADMRDGTYASAWPEAVLHGELERWAASSGVKGPRQRNIHVIGAEEGSDWAGDPKDVFARLPNRDKEHERRIQVADALAMSVRTNENGGNEVGILVDAIEYVQEELEEKKRGRGRRVKESREDGQKVEFDESPMRQVCAQLRAHLSAAGVSATEQRLTSAALEWHWERLENAESFRTLREAAFLQVQIVMLSPDQRETALAQMTEERERDRKEAGQDAETLREKEGIEVDLPKPGLFNRVKALIWRR
jgi:hypothetical protein